MRIRKRRLKEGAQTALRIGPRWLFLATLIYAPWAYGCTTSATIAGLNWLLAFVLVGWLAGCAVVRRAPLVPRVLLAIVVALLLLGWWMVLNAHSVYDSDYFVFVQLRPFLPALPGSIDRLLSAAWMVRATTILGTACFVADLSMRREWLMRLWITVGAAGGSVAGLGLLQKATHAQKMFWNPVLLSSGREISTFFGSFYYHANAGAFLNLVLPPTIGLALRAFTKRASPTSRSVWLTAALMTSISVLANTSRAAQLLGGILLGIILLGPVRRALGRMRTTERNLAMAGAVVLILAAIGVGQASRLDQPWARWQQLPTQLPRDARWLVAQAAWRGSGDAGWLGLGPGTFRVAFPYLTAYLGDRVKGVWRFLHEDYLQTLLEWGRLGALLWSAFLFGGIFIAIRNSRFAAEAGWSPRRRTVLPLIYLPLIATALHATIDFPLQIASIQLYVATYLGICWGSSLWQGRAPESELKPSSAR